MVDKAPVLTEDTGISLSTSVSNDQTELEKKEVCNTIKMMRLLKYI